MACRRRWLSGEEVWPVDDVAGPPGTGSPARPASVGESCRSAAGLAGAAFCGAGGRRPVSGAVSLRPPKARPFSMGERRAASGGSGGCVRSLATVFPTELPVPVRCSSAPTPRMVARRHPSGAAAAHMRSYSGAVDGGPHMRVTLSRTHVAYSVEFLARLQVAVQVHTLLP